MTLNLIFLLHELNDNLHMVFLKVALENIEIIKWFYYFLSGWYTKQFFFVPASFKDYSVQVAICKWKDLGHYLCLERKYFYPPRVSNHPVSSTTNLSPRFTQAIIELSSNRKISIRHPGIKGSLDIISLTSFEFMTDFPKAIERA